MRDFFIVSRSCGRYKFGVEAVEAAPDGVGIIEAMLMVHHVKNLSADQRLAIESLLGRALRDEESLTIRPARILKDAPTGEERTHLFRQYQDHLDQLADRVKHVPENEIDAAIDEAIRHVRHKAE